MIDNNLEFIIADFPNSQLDPDPKRRDVKWEDCKIKAWFSNRI